MLIYPGGMKNNGITTSIINLLENVDYETYDITLFTNKSKNLEVLNNLNSINKNVRIILRVPPLAASLKETYRIDFVRQRGLKKYVRAFDISEESIRKRNTKSIRS